MSYNGKHIATNNNSNQHITVQQHKKSGKIKNNPVINRGIVIAVAASITFLSLTGVIANKVHKNNEDGSKTAYEEIQNNSNIISILNNYYSNCTNYNQKLITSEMLRYCAQSNCTFEELYNSKDIIYNMVLNNFIEQGYTLVHEEEFNNETYNYIVYDASIMENIEKYCEEFGVSEALEVGFACSSDQINKNDIFNFNQWGNINSSQNVYNFVEQKNYDLSKYVSSCHSSIESQTRYSLMAFRQCLKEASGQMYTNDDNEYDAIDYYLDKSNRSSSSKVSHKTTKDKILTAALKYANDYKLSFNYKFNIANIYDENAKEYTYNFVFDDLSEYLENDFQDIMSYLSLYMQENTHSLS